MLGNDLLRGEKVYLDSISRQDIPLYGQWFSDLEFLSYLFPGAIFPLNEEDETEWFENARKSNDVNFAIRLLETGQLIGNVSLKAPDWRNRCAELGIAVGDKTMWGKGYGTDASRVILRYGFLELNLNRIELVVYSFNTRAIKSYEKIGFVHEGIRRQAIFRDGQYHDIHIMAILREEWQNATGK
jgi:RimJ/RimL family protein N-acetyltransferase